MKHLMTGGAGGEAGQDMEAEEIASSSKGWAEFTVFIDLVTRDQLSFFQVNSKVGGWLADWLIIMPLWPTLPLSRAWQLQLICQITAHEAFGMALRGIRINGGKVCGLAPP